MRTGERADLDTGAFCKRGEQRAGQVLLRVGQAGPRLREGLLGGGSGRGADFI